jgi:Mn2+/Fe2+ NRAMP family transporter
VGDKDFEQAPQFFWLFTIIIVISAGLILIPNAPLMSIMFISQVVNGVVLRFVLMIMITLTIVMTVDMVAPGLLMRIFSF